MNIIEKGTDVSKYYSEIGEGILKADIVLVNNEYHLDNIELYNNRLDYEVKYGKTTVKVVLTYCNKRVTNISMPLSTLRSSITGQSRCSRVSRSVVITSEFIEKKMSEIIMNNGYYENKKLLLINRNVITVMNIFKDLIDESKPLFESNLKSLLPAYRMKFFSYNWIDYIKSDRFSSENCNKEFTFKLFKENIDKLLDGTKKETVGFKTAGKFIDVFLNV